MNNLSTEELKKISLEKNKKGNATSKALKAQKIIWERAGQPFVADYYRTNNQKHTSNDYDYLS